MRRVLLVEDDIRISDHICKLLQGEGMAVDAVTSVSELNGFMAQPNEPLAVILDRLLGTDDSKDKMPEIKKRWPTSAILVISAINTPVERAELLNLGADDYLGKPFLSQELLARVHAVLRRSMASQGNYRKVGDLVLDIPRRILSSGNFYESLPTKEFMLMKLLSEDSGRVFSRNELLDMVWGNALEVETNVVEATIANLRKRIQHLGSSVQIKNMRNVGYFLEA
jgi:DNA-binding response OmpR family regulator